MAASALAADAAASGAPHQQAPPRRPRFGLYVHWPFCVSKCPYCDFNSHVAGRVDEAAWRDALVAELDHYASETDEDTQWGPLDSVFFGGGTPSLMPPAVADAVLAAAADRWGFAPDVEITLEANPSSAEARKFADFRAAGVNRLSLGVQAFEDAALRFLGRAHDARGALDAISIAERTFPRFSFDLIYALPGQTAAAWRATLREGLARAGDHLSLYQLTIEKGTAFFAAHRAGAFRLPGEDLAADLYELTAEETEKAGFPAYEISNHARPGGECRHNLVYWQGGDYVGIGPGAHGRLTRDGLRRATEQIPGPDNWLAAVRRQGHGTRKSGAVSPPERIEEYVLSGLRLARGIDRAPFEAAVGRTLEECVDGAAVAALSKAGFLVLDDAGLRATAAGRQRLNALVARVLS